MESFNLAAIAVALGMDAFAVSAAVSAALPTVTARHTFRLSWHFGLFQSLMTVVGWSLGAGVSTYLSAVDHWIAFGLLAAMGLKMIYESLDPERRPLDYDPSRGLSLISLSVATSLDALAVGFSLQLVGIAVWYPATLIGVVALIMAFIGTRIGKRAGRHLGRWAERIGGCVLIGIGLRILIEHLTI